LNNSLVYKRLQKNAFDNLAGSFFH